MKPWKQTMASDQSELIKIMSEYITHTNNSYYSVLGEHNAQCAIDAIEKAGYKIVKLTKTEAPTLVIEDDTIDKRPVNCRMRLEDEKKPYPKSGCDYCTGGGIGGCPFEEKEEPEEKWTDIRPARGAVSFKTVQLPKEEWTTCTTCNGKGTYLEGGDLHRSAGMVPCRNCSNGVRKTKEMYRVYE